MTTYLYWIHYDQHSDPFSEGYIGISSQPNTRFRYHSNKNTSDNSILFRAICKGAKQTILCEYNTPEEALQAEIKYRPTEKIGWNIIPGGISPPSRKGSKNKKLSEYNATKIVSQETKLKMSAQGKGRRWYTDGQVNTKAFDCPPGFKLGRTKLH